MVNENATLYSKKSKLINASLDRVWEFQSNIRNWPSWQEDVKKVEVEDQVIEGIQFKWIAGGAKITSRIEEYKPMSVIGWSGKSLGLKAKHWWFFKEVNKQTEVITEESLDGWLAKIIKAFKPNFLDENLEDALEKLRKVSEEE